MERERRRKKEKVKEEMGVSQTSIDVRVLASLAPYSVRREPVTLASSTWQDP
jgi:hypothetical protein